MIQARKFASLFLILIILTSFIPLEVASYGPLDPAFAEDEGSGCDSGCAKCEAGSCSPYEACNSDSCGCMSGCAFSQQKFLETIDTGNVDLVELAGRYGEADPQRGQAIGALNDYMFDKYGVSFSFDDKILSGITIKDGVMSNNGKALELTGLKDSFAGISAYEYNVGDKTYYGFSFIGKGGETIVITGPNDPISYKDGNFVVGDYIVTFDSAGGSINFGDDGKVELANGEFKSGENTIFGNSEFYIDSSKKLDYTKPITMMGDKSYACIGESCARNHVDGMDLITDTARDFKGGTDPKIKICINCEAGTLAILDSEVESDSIGGYIFWDKKVTSSGEMGDHAVARGKILANFNDEIIEGYHKDIVYDALADGAEVDDIQFTFLGEKDKNAMYDGEVGRILRGSEVIVLDKQYGCEKSGFLGMGCSGGEINRGVHAQSTDYSLYLHSVTADTVIDTAKAALKLGLFNNLGLSPQEVATRWGGYDMVKTECARTGSDCAAELQKFVAESAIRGQPLDAATQKKMLSLLGEVDTMISDPGYDTSKNVMVHHETFKTDPSDGSQVDVENLYVMTADGQVMVSQEVVHETVFDFWLNNKYLKQAYTEYLESAGQGITVDVDTYVQNRMASLQHEMWFESQRHELNGWIEFMDDSNWNLKSNIKSAIFDKEGAYTKLKEFNTKMDGMKEIDSLMASGMTLQQIYDKYATANSGCTAEHPCIGSQTPSDIMMAFSDPGLMFDLGKEQILSVALGGGGTYTIPNCDSNCVFQIPAQTKDAMLRYNNLVAETYREGQYFDKAKEYYTQGILLTSSADLTTQEFDSVIANLGKITQNEGQIIWPSEISALISSGKISEDQLRSIYFTQTEEANYNTQTGIAKFLTELVPDTYFDVALTLLGSAKVAQEGFIASKAAYLAMQAGEIGYSKLAAVLGKGLVNIFTSAIFGINDGVMKYSDSANMFFKEGQTIRIMLEDGTMSEGWKILGFLDDGTVRIIGADGVEKIVASDMVDLMNLGDKGLLLSYFSKASDQSAIDTAAAKLMAADPTLTLADATQLAKVKLLQDFIIKQEEINYANMLKQTDIHAYWAYFEGKVDDATMAFIDKQHAAYDHTMGELGDMFAEAGVTGRMKDPAHLEEKIFRDWSAGGLSRDEFFSIDNPLDLTIKDVVGTRVTVNTLDEARDAAALIQSKIDSGDWLLIKMKDFVENPNEGYRSIHYQLVVDDVPVEVQIRTPGQTAWADWDHDIIYKGTYGNVPEIKEYANKASDWVYAVDTTPSGAELPECPPCPEMLAQENLCFSC
jgi:ppGpp synthetase/RelA/SpoT-type nucleotidyltranferase